jgi:signal transduction histidine kinase
VHKSLEKNLPFLIEEFSSSGTSIDKRWKSILQRFFADCKLTESIHAISKCKINSQHNVLEVPAIFLKHGYLISASDKSTEFNTDDLELASSLLKLTTQFITIEEAFERGAAIERQRIARDLHDDVAARMLTLIHTVTDEKSIAISRSILKSLRNSIYTLDNKSTALILDAITDVRAEIQDRINSVGMQLIWHQGENLNGLSFTPRQHINLNRILHEITTNIIRHADAQFMEIIIAYDDQQLTIECSDNGKGFDTKNCIPGKGLNNIKTRAQELDGDASWFNLNDPKTGENKGSCVRVNFTIANTLKY